MNQKKQEVSRNTLKMNGQIKLADLMRLKYAESGQNDVEFAKYATEALGFQISGGNVRGIRDALGIESNFESGGRGGQKKDRELVELRQRVGALEAKLETLIAELGGVKRK